MARVTVRQAISLLAGEGMLSPQRGRGTFVTEKAGKLRQLRVEMTLDDLVAMYSGEKPEHATIEERIAIPRMVEADGLAAPKYFQMRRVHSRDGEPYCVISIFMDYRIFRRAPSRFRKELVLPVLTSLPGLKIASGRQTLSIAKADADVARWPGISIGAPTTRVCSAPLTQAVTTPLCARAVTPFVEVGDIPLAAKPDSQIEGCKVFGCLRRSEAFRFNPGSL